MPVSVDYVTRETAANLWRHRLMTIAAVLTVAVSLSLVGAALLLRQGAAKAEVDWQRGTQVTVWMQPTAATAERNAVKTELAALSYVQQPCIFRDQQENYEQAKSLLTPDEYSVLTVSDMPTSFWCTPAQPADAKEVIARFSGQPGVRNVTAPLAQIHSEEEVITVLQAVFLIVALVLLISAAVLILNTIRMAIFARRREVSVMKLVGATNWFIRVPFMSEGLIQGLIGSAIAAATVYGLHVVLNDLGNPDNPGAILTQMRMTGWEVFVTDVVVVLVGVFIGTLGSAIAIRRFLDV
jgi:cell division transport system permease protein